jgi:hypothetical protein
MGVVYEPRVQDLGTQLRPQYPGLARSGIGLCYDLSALIDRLSHAKSLSAPSSMLTGANENCNLRSIVPKNEPSILMLINSPFPH